MYRLVFPALLARKQSDFDFKRSSPVLLFCAAIPRSLAAGIGAGRAMKFYFSLCLLVLTMITSAEVMAASADEIQVYDEAINKIGELNVDIHMNYVGSGAKTPSYTGEIPSHHDFRVTPEFAYGFTNNLEGGLYIPVIRAADGNGYLEGIKLRLKYIGDNREHGFYWGINGELGSTSIRTSEQRLNFEIRPIIGYKTADWNLTANPISGFAISGNKHTPGFSPAFKISHKETEKTWLNIEHYADFGDMNNTHNVSQETYLSSDTEIFGHDLNVGIGHGWTGADNLTIKVIFNVPL